MPADESTPATPLPPVPDRVAPVDPGLPGLCIAQPVRPGPFLIEGHRARIVGRQAEPGGQALLHGSDGAAVATVTLAAPDSGRAANLLLYPGVTRRDLSGPDGMAIESLAALRTLPLLVWQVAGTRRPLTVRFATPDGRTTSESDGRAVRVAAGDSEILVGVAPQGAPPATRTRDGVLEVSVEPSGDEPVTVFIAWGRPDEVRAAMAAGRHLPGHLMRAASGPEELLRLETGVEALDDGIGWAQARLRASGRDAGSPLLAGLALISSGDRDGARDVVDQLEDDPARAALLLAQRAAAFGELRGAEALAGRLLRDAPDAVARMAAGRLADGLTHGAPTELIERLRAFAREAAHTAPSAERPTGSSRRLPMVGGGPTPQPTASSTGARALPMAGRGDARMSGAPHGGAGGLDPARWLEGLLDGRPVRGPDSADVMAARARRAAARFAEDPTAAWADWRAVLDEGLAGGPGGPGTWTPLAPPPVDPTAPAPDAAAELLLAFTQGLLGYAPDAPVGRLGLAPRLPPHLNHLVVRGIPLGDGSIGLTCVRSEGAVEYTLEPERMSVPPLIVFEPCVGSPVHRTYVDGRPAELDIRGEKGGFTVPVQLPLDRSRTMVVELED